MRIDFHFTTAGWRISEVNSDVPGGFIEASGLTRLMAAEYPGSSVCGDPAATYAAAVGGAVAPGALVALVHATAYTDDRQVMICLERELRAEGLRTALTAPDQLAWNDGKAAVVHAQGIDLLDAIVRFFPGEWLPELPRRSGWRHFFAGSQTPLSNPAAALVTQSKRFPLVWDELRTPLAAWRELLTETADPRACDWRRSDGWVLKPALGRVGEDIGLVGVTAEKPLRAIRRDAARHPAWWAAQRRFEIVPLATAAGPAYACLGVYTVDGRAAGVYGRLARTPLIHYNAQDVAVLVAAPARLPPPRRGLEASAV
jgi:glutathionylspermidine synthase